MIKPEELTEMKGETGIIIRDKNENKKPVSRRRDVIMNWKNSCSLVILAVESQKEISYAMPVRNMLYDALAYVDQMKVIWSEILEEERPKKYTDEFFSRLVIRCSFEHVCKCIICVLNASVYNRRTSSTPHSTSFLTRKL